MKILFNNYFGLLRQGFAPPRKDMGVQYEAGKHLPPRNDMKGKR